MQSPHSEILLGCVRTVPMEDGVARTYGLSPSAKTFLLATAIRVLFLEHGEFVIETGQPLPAATPSKKGFCHEHYRQ